MPPPSEYLAVLKASYDYEPQSDDELAIKEDQVLLLVERVDDDWWKVKVKDASDDEVGLVPAAYVEKADHTSVVKAVYDYDAGAPGELSVKEDDVLYVYDKEEDWLLVQTDKDGGKVGFVPGTYVEETGGEGATAAADEQEEDEEEEPSQASQIIVPPSPPRPSSVLMVPADRTSQLAPSIQEDSIQIWAVSEVDKKGKKKKGTLGIGNGAIFFSSESDKTPVQKWQTSDIESSRIDKSKHVYIEVGGTSAASLHYNAGSKDTAEAIVEKLESSKGAWASSSTTSAPPSPPAETTAVESKPKKNGISVHFASAPPSIISPREATETEVDDEEEYEHVQADEEGDDGMLRVTALYDFSADGEDELSVTEGERLILLERDGDEWWKVRNASGAEGVVPAQYVELDQAASAILDEADSYSSGPTDKAKADREKEEMERRDAEKQQREEAEEQKREADIKKRVDNERRVRAAKAATEAAEADRKRKEREQKEKEAEEEREAEATRERERASPASRTPRTSSATPAKPSRSDSRTSEDGPSSSKGRGDSKTRPSPQRTRVWHDITGQFSVEAEFLAYANGKLRLHKVNGVVIEVPAAKMSPEDLKYVERVTGKAKRQLTASPSNALSDDDEPLAVRRRSLQPEPRQSPKSVSPPKKAPPIDWFDFFLSAGCELDDCTRYASSFERDKMDASLLPDISEQTMRSLGLREGDIIRVTKAIALRTGTSAGKKDDSAIKQQMQRDEDLAKQLQEEENGGPALPRRQTTSPAPNLFAGPGGQLKNNTRRGRPQPSKTKSTPPASVDLISITTASEQINRIGSPSALSALASSPTSVQSPARSGSTVPVVGGFDDDAWTNRPSSTKPVTPVPTPAPARAPSAPPAQTAAPPAPPAPPVATAPTITATASAPASIPPPSASPNVASPSTTSNSLARTTTSDVFDQLARLSMLKTQSPSAHASPPIAVSPVVSPPPVGFQQGLGMGSSPVPMGQIQIQPTGLPQNNNAARGPYAPVPQNQGLLQPLVPTTTGFNGFIPTRPASTPMNFQATGFQPQPQQQQNSFQAPSHPSFLSAQNGFGGPISSQPTGFPNSGPLMSQPTGFGASPFGGGVSYNSALNRPVGSLQPAMTGFNPGFNPSFNSIPTPPPVPSLPPSVQNSNINSTAPANVFAQMKAGTFGKDDAPQPSNRYDALRPQPTGWGTYQNGFSGQYY